MPEQFERAEASNNEDESVLTISPEKVCFIIIKAKEFDAKDEVTEPDPGSNPADDRDVEVLEEHSDDHLADQFPLGGRADRSRRAGVAGTG